MDNKINKRRYTSMKNKRILVAPYSTLGADDGFGVAMVLELVEKRLEAFLLCLLTDLLEKCMKLSISLFGSNFLYLAVHVLIM